MCIYIILIHTHTTMTILNKSTNTNMLRLISLSLSYPVGKVIRIPKTYKKDKSKFYKKKMFNANHSK